MRIALVNPNHYRHSKYVTYDGYLPEWGCIPTDEKPQIPEKVVRTEHLGLGYLAAVLRSEGFHVRIVDAHLQDLSLEATVDKILRIDPDAIGISILQAYYEDSVILARTLKKNLNSPVIVGGHFPTAVHEEILKENPCLDYVIRGEGEYTLLSLVRKLGQNKCPTRIRGISFRMRDRIVTNSIRPAIRSLDKLPFPARDTTHIALDNPLADSSVYISGSRGCMGRCIYCSVSTFYRSIGAPCWRGRSPGNIADEAERVIGGFRVKGLRFIDDDFLGYGRAGERRALAVLEEIKKRGLDLRISIFCRPDQIRKRLFSNLSREGLTTVYIGVESFNPEILKLYARRHDIYDVIRALDTLKSANIETVFGMIMYSPFTTLKELERNFLVLEKLGALKPEYAGSVLITSFLAVFRGTPLESFLRRKGLLWEKGLAKVGWEFEDSSVKSFYLEFMRRAEEENYEDITGIFKSVLHKYVSKSESHSGKNLK